MSNFGFRLEDVLVCVTLIVIHPQVKLVQSLLSCHFITSSSQALNVNKLLESVLALALCHNVNPIKEEHEEPLEDDETDILLFSREAPSLQSLCYQASSPDEVILLFCRECYFNYKDCFG